MRYIIQSLQAPLSKSIEFTANYAVTKDGVTFFHQNGKTMPVAVISSGANVVVMEVEERKDEYENLEEVSILDFDLDKKG